MKKPQFFIPISIKIFGITTSLLCLLGIIALTAQYRLRRVNQEVSDLAQYITPTTNHISRIEVQGLEQKLHFERILKLYTIQPIDTLSIESEWQQFETRSQTVHHEISVATTLAKTGSDRATISAHQKRFQQIERILSQIERSHQTFHNTATNLFQTLEKTSPQDSNEGRTLNTRALIIEKSVDDLDRTISRSRVDLQTFTQQTALLSQQYQQRVLRESLLLTSSAIILGLLYSAAVTVSIVRPVRQLTQRVQSLQETSPEPSVAVEAKDEVGILTNVFNQMLEELKAKEDLKKIFGKYIDPRIVERLTGHDVALKTQGEKRIVSVLMSDLSGIDLTHQITDSVQLVDAVNQYLSLLSPTISNYQGLIEFVETTIKGFWTAPFVSETQHAQLACEAALQQVSQLDKIRVTLSNFIDPSFDAKQINFHIGLATGPLVLANIGPDWSKTYTVLGDIVNISARLKGAAQYFGVPILMMESTQQQVKTTMATRELGVIQVVGKYEKLRVYELLGPQQHLGDPLIELKTSFEEGLAAYRQQAWSQAQAYFENCLAICPQDGPAQRYLHRVQTLRSQPLPDHWDDVWKLAQK